MPRPALVPRATMATKMWMNFTTTYSVIMAHLYLWLECPGQDLNLHAFRQGILNPRCLPVSPPGQTGGGSRNRTGVHGFAGRCMTTLPSRQKAKREGLATFPRKMERETSLELATSTLARLRSTN